MSTDRAAISFVTAFAVRATSTFCLPTIAAFASKDEEATSESRFFRPELSAVRLSSNEIVSVAT